MGGRNNAGHRRPKNVQSSCSSRAPHPASLTHYFACYRIALLLFLPNGGAVAQLGARLDGIEEVVGSNPIGSTKNSPQIPTGSLCALCALSVFSAIKLCSCRRQGLGHPYHRRAACEGSFAFGPGCRPLACR
jgi:hypothetical protein